MPPKQAAKGKTPKSEKLSKAEKEKLKKEEAERKAKEEEEARIREEEEKREQEERERIEREEKERLWEAEKARHQAELDEVKEALENNAQQLRTLEESHKVKAKWDRYMLCDGSPDPCLENELNTFMHLWKEEQDGPTPKPVKEVLEECENTLMLISELEHHIQDSEYEGLTEEDILRHKESITKLQDLLNFILDRSTMQLLQNASDNVDPESQNLQFLTTTEHLTLCLWGNIAKNPRLKSVTFEKQGFNIEIPKSLAVGEVSIRVLLTAYDHLSSLAKSFHPKQKKPEVVVEVSEPTEEEKKEEGEEEAKKEEDEQRDVNTPKSASVISRASKTSRRKSAARTGSSKSTRSRRASAKSVKSQVSEQNSQKETIKEVEPEAEEGADDATKTDQPGEEVLPEPTPANAFDEEDDDDDDDDVVDLRAFGVIGPIMFIELLELPPQPKHVKNWTIQQIVSPDLKRLPYQTQSGTNTLPGSASSTNAPPLSASNSQFQASNPPLAISFRLPNNVIYFEKPQLAWWEPSKKQWRLDGLDDIQYEEETRTMSFKTTGFGPISTTQDLYLNMPFQSWEIRPHKTNNCLFTLIAAIIELEIEIKDDLCCLSQPDDIEEVSHLIGQWMKPQDFIKAMQTAGVNVFPAVDAEKYVSINKKDEKLENEVYQEIALTASAFAYSWSKWNADSGVDKIVLQTAEQLQDDLLLEEDWSLYLLTTRSSCKLKMKEEDTEFSDNSADNTQLHSNLYHMVRDGASEKALQRIKDSSFLFVDCVYQLLSATKVITYS